MRCSSADDFNEEPFAGALGNKVFYETGGKNDDMQGSFLATCSVRSMGRSPVRSVLAPFVAMPGAPNSFLLLQTIVPLLLEPR